MNSTKFLAWEMNSKFFESGKHKSKERNSGFAECYANNYMPSVDLLIAQTLKTPDQHSSRIPESEDELLKSSENSAKKEHTQWWNDSTEVEESKPALTEVLSKLTVILKYFNRCTVYEMDTEISLDKLLTEACKSLYGVVLSKTLGTALNIPLQLLIKICDVYNATIWNKSRSMLNFATNTLAKKTFLGHLHEVALETQNCALPDAFIPLEYACTSVFLVKLLMDVEDTDSCGDILMEFIVGGNYWKDVTAEHTSKRSKIKEQMIYCIKVEDACRFWAYVGEDWQIQLEDLHDAMLESLDMEDDDFKEIQKLTEPPSVKDLLLISSENTPFVNIGLPYIRVRVIGLMEDKAKLWCVDFAEYIVQPWNLLRRCPPDLLKYPVLAKLCKLSGLAAKPPVQIIKSATMLLVMFFSHWTFEVNEELASNFFKVFMQLCDCPDIAIKRLAMLCIMSFANLENAVDNQSSHCFHSFVRLFLSIVRSLTKSPSNFSGDSIKEVHLIISVLRALLVNCFQLRLHFAKERGLQIVMQLIQKKELESKLRMELWKLLKIVFGPEPYLEETKSPIHQISYTNVSEAVPQMQQKHSRLPRRSIKHFLQERQMSIQMAEPFCEKDYTIDASDYQCVKPKEKISEHRFLIRGHLFRVQPSNTALMLDRRSTQHAVDIELMRNICALLNSGMGGSIYIGINEKNVVEGMCVLRKHRDEIRLVFVKMLESQLVPHVPPDFYELFYLKVFEKDVPRQNDLTQHFQSVIQIKIKPVSSTLFQLKNGHCYFVENGKAKQANAQEMRNKVIEAAERQLKSGAKK